MMRWLKTKLIRWLLADSELDIRFKYLEQHFVTKRDPESGQPTETLADVPLAERKRLRAPRLRGSSWQQTKAMLEATDGGRRELPVNG